MNRVTRFGTSLLLLLLAAGLGGLRGRAYGQSRGALSLDGESYARAADDDVLDIDGSAITIEAWIKHDGKSDADAVILTKSDTDGNIDYQLNLIGQGDEVPVEFTVGTYSHVISDLGVPAGRWTHIAGTYDGNALSIYINGVLSGTENTGGPNTNDGPLTIGADAMGSAHFFSGEIDEVRMWNVTRTLIQLKSSLYSALTTGETGLVAYYSFSGDANDAELTSNLTLVGGAAIVAPGIFPVPPDLFATTGIGSRSAILNWVERLGSRDANKGASFNIYRSAQADLSDRQLVDNVDHGPYGDTGLTNGTTYFYQITSVDATGNESDYSNVATATPYETGGGGSLSLDGQAYAQVENRPSLTNGSQALTVEAWVKHDGNSEADAIILTKSDTDGNIDYQLNLVGQGEEVPVEFTVGTYGHVTSEAGIPFGQWTHIAGTFDGSTLSIYINGELSGAANSTSAGQNDGPFTIGANAAGNANFFSGLIDEVRIWNITRSPFDIEDHFRSSLVGSEDGLQAYFQFNDVGAAVAAGSDVGPAPIYLVGDAEIVATGVFPVPPRIYAVPFVASGLHVAQLSFGVRGDSPTTTFKIYRSTAADGSDRELVTMLRGTDNYTYNDIGLTSGTTYYYQVTATDNVESDFSYPVSITADEKPGNALVLDGDRDYAQVPDEPSLDIGDESLTVEAWVKHDGNGNADAVILTKSDTDGNIDYQLNLVGQGDEVPIEFTAGTYGHVTSDVNVSAGQWTHIAGTYDGDSISIYVNGELHGREGSSSAGQNDGPFTIGANAQGNDRFFSGEIDEVRVWDVVRTASEIADNQNSLLTGGENDLRAYFRFDETGGQVARGSVNEFSHNLALVGDAMFTGATDNTALPTETDVPLPKAFTLEGNYPNPFDMQTTIHFGLPQASAVRVTVYDLLGREVAVVADGKTLAAGWHDLKFDASSLPSGVYLYRVQAGDRSDVGRMILVR